jgi:hypothetical protein
MLGSWLVDGAHDGTLTGHLRPLASNVGKIRTELHYPVPKIKVSNGKYCITGAPCSLFNYYSGTWGIAEAVISLLELHYVHADPTLPNMT